MFYWESSKENTFQDLLASASNSKPEINQENPGGVAQKNSHHIVKMSLGQHQNSNGVNFTFSKISLDNHSSSKQLTLKFENGTVGPTMSIVATTQTSITENSHKSQGYLLLLYLLSGLLISALAFLTILKLKTSACLSLLLSQFSVKIEHDDLGEQKICEDEFIYISKKI